MSGQSQISYGFAHRLLQYLHIPKQCPQSASKNQVYFRMLMNVHSKRKLYNQLL